MRRFADAHRGKAVLRRPLGHYLGGSQSGDLPETKTTVEADRRAVVTRGGDRGGRPDAAAREPGGVHRHQMRAVRIDASQIGLDQELGNRGGLVGGNGMTGEDAGSAQRANRRLAPRANPSSGGHVSRDRHPVQGALGACGVTDDRVLGAAVVPDDEVTDLPLVAIDVLRQARLRVQVLQQRRAVLGRPADRSAPCNCR